jgi:UDP-N-acetylglucosamine 2-epimerase
MLDQVLDLFSIRPNYDLNIMRPDQSLSQVTSAVIQELDAVIKKTRPDWVIVQGDTTTVMAASLVAFYHRVKIGHVEAGLRTRDKQQPFPEEINRRITDVLADAFFAPTALARKNLLREGIDEGAIHVTGNTVVDALLYMAAKPFDWSRSSLASLPDKRLVLITAHRREHFGARIRDVCLAIRDLALRYARDCHFVYPVHLNSNVRVPAFELLSGRENISLIEPLDYLSLINLMKRATLILTDSGGIQEEAPTFGVPVLVLRDSTERPEAIQAGTAQLVGTNREKLVGTASRLLDDPDSYSQMSRAANPFGDGQAAQRIVQILMNGSLSRTFEERAIEARVASLGTQHS